MEWNTLRSRRDPRFWVPWLCALALVAVLSASAHLWTHAYLQGLETLRISDPEAALAAAESGLRVLGLSVCGFALVSSALLIRYFQLGLREHRLPPSGWWSLGSARVAVGPGIQRLCRVGVGLSLIVAGAGVGCLLSIHRLLAAAQP